MADSVGRLPLQAEMASNNREVSGNGQLFAGTKAEKGAIVADAELESAGSRLSRTCTNPGEQVQLALVAGTPRFCWV